MGKKREFYEALDIHGINHVFHDLNDMVNHPPHYANRRFEVIDVMKDTMSAEQFKGYCLGATLKYLMRLDKKNNTLEDAKKAHWYLTKLIQTIEEETTCCGS